MVKDSFALLDEEKERILYPLSEILVDINKIAIQNGGEPEGLIDYFKPYPIVPWLSEERVRARFLFGYQFDNGGFYLKTECSSVYMYDDPKEFRQFIAKDGPIWDKSKEFYVERADTKYFGRLERVRQSVQFYFVDRGFSKK